MEQREDVETAMVKRVTPPWTLERMAGDARDERGICEDRTSEPHGCGSDFVALGRRNLEWESSGCMVVRTVRT